MCHTALICLLLWSLARAAAGAEPLRVPLYDADPNHLLNRLHVALFERTRLDGLRGSHVELHSPDPFLYQQNFDFLYEGESHANALKLLDEAAAQYAGRALESPVKRMYLQHDLWAAFDHFAWVVDDWVYRSAKEPAAIAMRTRLAKVIGELLLTQAQFAALPDNYALAVNSKAFPTAYDPANPQAAFLPPDLFDEKGPWVRLMSNEHWGHLAVQHDRGAGNRSHHFICLNLPGGRSATVEYIKSLKSDPKKQFPPGTMVALGRRALVIDDKHKIRFSPITEQLQIRVFNKIPIVADADLHDHGADASEQSFCEFTLDRPAFFAGGHGLRATTPSDVVMQFDRTFDPFTTAPDRQNFFNTPALKTCLACHAFPGVRSLISFEQFNRSKERDAELTERYAWKVAQEHAEKLKAEGFGWGLLRGMLER